MGVFRKQDWAEISEALDPLNPNYSERLVFPKTYKNHIFNDNFGIQHKSLKETMSGSFNPESFTECFFYLRNYDLLIAVFILIALFQLEIYSIFQMDF